MNHADMGFNSYPSEQPDPPEDPHFWQQLKGWTALFFLTLLIIYLAVLQYGS